MVWLALVLAAQGSLSPESEVRRLEDERVEAMLARDAAALRRLLADDLTYTHSTGRTQTKAEFIRQYTETDERYTRFDRSDVKIRAYGDSAVVTGTAKMALQGGAAGERSFEIRFIDVWARRSGRWQMVAWHSTRLVP